MSKRFGMANKKKIRNLQIDTLRAITNSAIRRLARRGGVKRISFTVYDLARAALYQNLRTIMMDAITYTTHARRKTVIGNDVIFALKKSGKAIYGYGI
jgi:histone H4